MSYSFVTYTGSGVTGPYGVTFPYVSKDHVKVYVDDVLKTVDTDYSWPTDSTILFGSAVAADAEIKFQRESNRVARLVNHQDASNLTEETLDDDANQVFFVAQEALDVGDDIVNRAIQVSPSVSGVDTQLPAPQASHTFGWNAAGTALINYAVQVGTSLVDLATSAGSSLLGWIQSGAGAIYRSVETKLRESVSVEDFGFSTTATAAQNALYLRNAIASGHKRLCVTKPGNYALDNTTPIDFNVDDQYLVMWAGVNIVPSVPTVTVFRLLGTNVTVDGGKMTGPGTYNNTGSGAGRPVALVEVYGGASPTGAQDATIKNMVLVNAPNVAILTYRTVGVKILHNKIKSAMATSDVDRGNGMYIYSSARVLIEGNTVDGGPECIVGGGQDSGYSFDDFIGLSNNKDCRDIIIRGNTLVNFRDHGVYFSSNCARISVVGNHIVSAIATASSGVKLWGSGIIAHNHIASMLAGIQGRNPFQLVIDSNRVFVDGSTTSASLIDFDGSAAYDINIDGITITNNYLRATNPLGILHGIYMYGMARTSNGAQNLIKNIKISNNTFSGTIGGVAGGSWPAVIHLFIEKHTTVASTVYGENISITDNVCDLEPITGGIYNCGHFLKLSGDASYVGAHYGVGVTGQAGFKGGMVTGNMVRNITNNFITWTAHSFIVDNNQVIPQGGSNCAIVDTADTHTPVGLNSYVMPRGGFFTLLSSASTNSILQDEIELDTAMAGDTTYKAYRPYRHLIYSPTAARAITQSQAAGTFVYPDNHLVTVHNSNRGAGAFNLTFEMYTVGPVLSTIASGTSKTYVWSTSSARFYEV